MQDAVKELDQGGLDGLGRGETTNVVQSLARTRKSLHTKTLQMTRE